MYRYIYVYTISEKICHAQPGLGPTWALAWCGPRPNLSHAQHMLCQWVHMYNCPSGNTSADSHFSLRIPSRLCFLASALFCTTFPEQKEKRLCFKSKRNLLARESSKHINSRRKALQELFRETLLFLPGTFWNWGVLVCSEPSCLATRKCHQVVIATPSFFVESEPHAYVCTYA